MNDTKVKVYTSLTAPDDIGLITHADYRALEERHLAYRNLTVEVSALQDQFSRYADDDCRDCDGRGVYYGNVCVCHCVTAKLEELATRTPKEQTK